MYLYSLELCIVASVVDSQFVVWPGHFLDAVISTSWAMSQVESLANRHVLKYFKYFQQKYFYISASLNTASKQTPVVLQSSVVALPYEATMLSSWYLKKITYFYKQQILILTIKMVTSLESPEFLNLLKAQMWYQPSSRGLKYPLEKTEPVKETPSGL